MKRPVWGLAGRQVDEERMAMIHGLHAAETAQSVRPLLGQRFVWVKGPRDYVILSEFQAKFHAREQVGVRHGPQLLLHRFGKRE